MLKFIVLLLASSAFSLEEVDFLSDEFIDLINSRQNSWVAGRNFPKDTPIEYFKSLACVSTDENIRNRSDLPLKNFTSEELRNVPHEFDARRQWPQCQSLYDIRNQGICGSCWAIAAAEVMTDRWCIRSNQDFYFSTEDIVTCANGAGSCQGGEPIYAFNFWTTTGVVSGGKAGSYFGCKPYTLSSVGEHDPTPPCNPQCQPYYNIPYQADKKFGYSAYQLNGEAAMKAEIFQNGPIVIVVDSYSDIHAYTTGVYVPTEGYQPGKGHAMKVLGWGHDLRTGSDYWLVANSWGTTFGHEGGFMKFLRGRNAANIETYYASAGAPRI